LKRKKILFVGPWPPPYGGIASNLYELLPQMYLRGYDLFTLSYSEDIIHEKTIEKNVVVFRFSPSLFFKKYIYKLFFRYISSFRNIKGLSIVKHTRAFFIGQKINKIINEENITHVFTYAHDQVYVLPHIDKGKLDGLFCTIYGALILTPDLYLTEKYFLKKALLHADILLSCSSYCVKSAEKFLDTKFSTKVIYNNVDKDLYNPTLNGKSIRYKHNISDDAIVIMTMGRISIDMGVDFIISNINRITAIDPRVIVLIVGAKGELCKEVINLASCNIQVRYAFDISFEEKPFYFASCDIFTAPTKLNHACMGIANIEAMMAGKAVISSDSGGHSETIENNVSGVLIPFKNGKLNTDYYLKELKNLILNEEVRIKFSKNGRIRALHLFTNEKIVQEHIDLIEEYSHKKN
jgi:glycosyltransferase involved in cell wall biosynthesis